MHKIFGRRFIFLEIIFLIGLFTSAVFAQEAYKIDPSHSTVGFAVRHMKVGITHGEFTDYSGEIQFDENNLDTFNANIVVKTASIDTRLEARDKHLRSADFFDVENYPTMTFKGKSLLRKGDIYEVTGDLTIRGVTREISFPVTISGPVQSPFGGEVIGISMSGEVVIDRRDWGVSWNDRMPDGGFVVGNDVRLIVDIEADKK